MTHPLEPLLLGHFDQFRLRANFDCANQQTRYDVVAGDLKHAAARGWARAIRDYRLGHWALPDGEIRWQPAHLSQVSSGVICVTSGRAEWFAREGVRSPIVLWCLLKELPVDVVTDACEAEDYRRALRDPENRRTLESELSKLAEGLGQPPSGEGGWRQRLGDAIQVVAVVSKGGRDLRELPRGFGFNRHMSLEWMRRRFTGLCATVDDNTASLGSVTFAALDWLFSPGNISRRVARRSTEPPSGGSWLCVSFRPCTVAVTERPAMSELRESGLTGASTEYDGSDLHLNAIDSPWIIQQFTVWNAATYAGLAGGFPPNYDHTLLTGKEDVDFFRRLTGAEETWGLVFCDETLPIFKCRADTRPNPDKKGTLIARIAEHVRHFCPAFGRIRDEDDGRALASVAARFRANGSVEESELRMPEGRRSVVRELLWKQNMVLEQILVPGL